MNETEAILQAGDTDAFDAGKRGDTPLGAMGAGLAACRLAAGVTIAARQVKVARRGAGEGWV